MVVILLNLTRFPFCNDFTFACMGCSTLVIRLNVNVESLGLLDQQSWAEKRARRSRECLS